MTFTQARKRSKTFQKVWFSDCGHYRITWVKRVYGVRVKRHFHVCVRVRRADGQKWWDFAGRRGPYRKYETALKAAEQHRKAWNQVLTIAMEGGRGRLSRMRDLAGRTGIYHIPIWVTKHPGIGIVRRCFESSDQSDPTPISTTLESGVSSETSDQSSGPAWDVAGLKASGRPAQSPAPLKETNSETVSDAPTAKARASGQGQRSRKPTASASSGGKRKSKRSSPGKPRKKAASRN